MFDVPEDSNLLEYKEDRVTELDAFFNNEISFHCLYDAQIICNYISPLI